MASHFAEGMDGKSEKGSGLCIGEDKRVWGDGCLKRGVLFGHGPDPLPYWRKRSYPLNDDSSVMQSVIGCYKLRVLPLAKSEHFVVQKRQHQYVSICFDINIKNIDCMLKH